MLETSYPPDTHTTLRKGTIDGQEYSITYKNGVPVSHVDKEGEWISKDGWHWTSKETGREWEGTVEFNKKREVVFTTRSGLDILKTTTRHRDGSYSETGEDRLKH
jgi:hypothetical protein